MAVYRVIVATRCPSEVEERSSFFWYEVAGQRSFAFAWRDIMLSDGLTLDSEARLQDRSFVQQANRTLLWLAHGGRRLRIARTRRGTP
jgi:hypothetical protein